MNRKDFVKKTALGMVAAAFAQWDLQAMNLNSEVDKWYYFRNVYSEKHNGKIYYHYNSILLSFDWERPIINEVIVADNQKEFPAGSFTVSRSKPMFKQLEEGKLMFRRQGTTVWGYDLTKRKRDRSMDEDFIFMQYRWLDLSELKSKTIIKISQDNERWLEVDLVGHFDMNTRTFIKKGNPDMVIPPYSHQSKEWIAAQEKDVVIKEEESVASNQPQKKKNNTKQQKDKLGQQEEEPIANNAPPKKKSFIQQQKEELGKQEEQRIRNRKTEYIDCREIIKIEDHPIDYLVQVKAIGKLAKGDMISVSIKNMQTFRNQPTKEYTFQYELLEDFKRKREIRIKCKSPQQNFSEMGNQIGLTATDFFKVDKIQVRETKYFDDVWITSDEAGLYFGGKLTIVIGGKESAGGCYLTTACVQHRGLADDCYELSTLRHFRDTYMKSTAEGAALIQRYYKIAPQIVEKIKSQSDSSERLEFIYQKLVLPAVEMIEQGKKELAMEYYAAFTLALEQKIFNMAMREIDGYENKISS
ncbi:MAG: CFI-box-CTERM domain-containing protein [Bacteroidota bacterium]